MTSTPDQYLLIARGDRATIRPHLEAMRNSIGNASFSNEILFFVLLLLASFLGCSPIRAEGVGLFVAGLLFDADRPVV